jgi:hypothetical protein
MQDEICAPLVWKCLFREIVERWKGNPMSYGKPNSKGDLKDNSPITPTVSGYLTHLVKNAYAF